MFNSWGHQQGRGNIHGGTCRHGVLFTGDRICSTLILLQFFSELPNHSYILWWVFLELLLQETQKRQTCSASSPADSFALVEPRAAHQIFTHASDSALLEAGILRSVQSLLNMRTREHVCVDVFPCYFTAPVHAQSPEAKQYKGVEGVKCLAGACSVSLCLSPFI